MFQGVYPSDKLLTSVLSYPALFIAKVDTSDKPGSHWVTFHFTKEKQGEYFDSYELPSSSYSGTSTNFLDSYSNSWIFNTVTLQSINSNVCGHYCRDINMSAIVHHFSNHKRRNDFLVKRFVEKYFPLSLKKYTHVNAQGMRAQHQIH